MNKYDYNITGTDIWYADLKRKIKSHFSITVELLKLVTVSIMLIGIVIIVADIIQTIK